MQQGRADHLVMAGAPLAFQELIALSERDGRLADPPVHPAPA